MVLPEQYLLYNAEVTLVYIFTPQVQCHKHKFIYFHIYILDYD